MDGCRAWHVIEKGFQNSRTAEQVVEYLREYVRKRNQFKSFYNLLNLYIRMYTLLYLRAYRAWHVREKLIDMQLGKVVANVKKRN